MSKSKWVIDPAHSEIQFKVKHLMISTVTGHFKKFNLEATTENDDFSTVQDMLFTIDTSSVDTNNKDRDTHLRSPDFLIVKRFLKLNLKAQPVSLQSTKANLPATWPFVALCNPLQSISNSAE